MFVLCRCCCSDNPGPTEAHRTDFGMFGYLSPSALNDCHLNCGSVPTVCETEVSPRCPFGWAYYVDADGSEGYDSCVYISPSTASSWSVANASCPAGSHLLTVKSGVSTQGLLPFATSLYHATGEKVYIGCRCETSLAVSVAVCVIAVVACVCAISR
jgi:hypothetical protein